jgi:heme oxygenase (biliverdin-IX-beta and delta-forming)
MDCWIRLRAATRSAHEAIERLPPLTRLFSDDYSRSELIAMFRAMLSVHEPLEALLVGTAEAVAIGYIPRSPLLRRGLARLGAANTVVVPVSIPAIATPAANLGAFYVIEGSILGGQIIRRRLLDHFGETIGDALTFYSPYGDDVGGQWIRFRTVLERIIVTDSLYCESERTALATFAAIASAVVL